MSASADSVAQSVTGDLERDGFVVVKSVLDKALVEQARRDLEAIYAKDLEERSLRNLDEQTFTHGSTKSILNKTTHLVLGLPGKSKALDDCYEKILTDPMTGQIIRAIAGEHIKIRDVNCRYMTGTYDGGDFLNPPHEWHRDSPGEFCIAIPLNDVAEGDNGATAVIPGSHRYPWCPRWNAMFGAPFYINRYPPKRGPSFLTRFNPFNRLLHKHRTKGSTGIYAKPGDFYIFLNDTWHGRVANLHGARAMIVMAGAFPTEFAFPDNPDPFPAEMVNRLPPKYRKAVSRDAPANSGTDTMTHRVLKSQRPDRPTDLFWWARKEKEAMVQLSHATLWCVQRVPRLHSLIRQHAAR
ncbi:MAG: phytanoyl-CoA dioxygenase family protein [Xanthobacteraceae bacterium]|nr:phytanoyl-CoA dioxygenase family protein [Xanthobacteraceae bacterium]